MLTLLKSARFKRSESRRNCVAEFFSVFMVSLILSAFLSIAFIPNISVCQAVTADLSITPPMRTVQMVGQLCNFSVDICNVANVSTVLFTIVFSASNLQCSKVVQGSFFPAPPASAFQYSLNGSLGQLTVNLSLTNPKSSLSGNGTLVSISFNAIQYRSSCLLSTIDFSKITLLNPSGQSIPCDHVAAVCFWASTVADPPGDGAISTSTNEGIGPYTFGETVITSALVTFDGDPVRNKLVAIQFVNPLDNTLTIAVGTTDQNGIFTFSFKVPETSSSIGNWTVFSTVELDQQIFWTTLFFLVQSVSTVGGFSYVLKSAQTSNLLPFYIVALVLLTLLTIVRKPKRGKAHAS